MGAVDFGYPAVSSVAQLRETVQQAAQKTAKDAGFAAGE